MIVSTSIDADGAVTVTVDSDGDQGDGYSTDVLKDAANRSTAAAIETWLAVHVDAEVDEDAEER